VRRHDPRGPQAGHRAERGGDHRHGGQVAHHHVEARQRRHVGEAHVLQRLDAAPAAGAVHQPDERQPQLVGHPLGVDRLLPDRRVRSPAAHGEVIALHDRAPAFDPPLADHDVGGREVHELAVVAVDALAGDRSGLVEAVAVEQALDPLAHRQAPRGVLALHALLAAETPGELLPTAKLLELWLPAHRRPQPTP
jgi:hypothetical protein